MNSQLLKLKQAILGNPWTSLVAVAGLVVLAIYAKVMTPAQILSLIVTILGAAGAQDGGKDKDV